MLAHPNPKRVPGAAKEVELWLFCPFFFGSKSWGFEKMEHPASIGRISFGDFPLKGSIEKHWVRGFLSHVWLLETNYDFLSGLIWEDDRTNIPFAEFPPGWAYLGSLCGETSLGEVSGNYWFVMVCWCWNLFLIQLDDSRGRLLLERCWEWFP